MKRIMTAAVAVLTVLAMPTVWAELTNPNQWTGAVSDKYGVDGNWSLGHVPTSTEAVVFPDLGRDYEVDLGGGDYQTGTIHIDYRLSGQSSPVKLTLKGGGSITANVTEDQYCFRSLRKVILDGVLLSLNGAMTLLYDRVTLKNRARFGGDNGFYIWAADSGLDIPSGCAVDFAGTMSIHAAGGVNVDGGSFSCKQISQYQYAVAPNISLNGGQVLISGNAPLEAGSRISIKGGKMIVAGTLSVPETGVTFDLTGGSLAAVNANDTTKAALNVATKGTVVGFGSLFAQEGEVLRLTAPLRQSGTEVLLPEGTTLESDYPVYAKNLKNADITKTCPTIKLKTFISDGPSPFANSASAAIDRYVNLVGPTELRTTAASSQSYGSFVLLTGDITVNTDDYNTPTVGRNIYLRFCTKGDANLTITGRGQATLLNPRTYEGIFEKVTVDANAKLVLGAEDKSRLETRELVLKAGSKIELTAGKQFIRAQKWTIDPTAQLAINIPDGYDRTSWMAAVTMLSGAVPFASNQVVLQGAGANGWSIAIESDAVAAVKPAAGVDGTYPYEWTGAGADTNFSTKENWYCQQNPPEYNILAFGAAVSVLNPYFDHIYNAQGGNGGSAGTIFFRETAVRTFTIGGATGTTLTCSNNGADDAENVAKWGVYNDSALPQKIVGPQVRHGANLALMGHREAPVLIKGNLITGTGNVLLLAGDIRFGGSSAINSVDFRASPSVGGTRFSVLKDGSLTVKGEKSTFAYFSGAPSYLSFGVEENATLIFATDNKADAVFDWWTTPAAHVVDGLLDVKCRFGNRYNQVFNGKGTLRVANPTRTSDETRALTLGGSLTFEPPAVWNTVTTAKPGAGWRLVARGTPTVKTAGDWTYGPEAGATPTAAAADRACEVYYGAMLTLDPNGNSVTFNDPVVGNGTLKIANGTLKLMGDVASTLSVAVKSGAAFEVGAAKTFTDVELEPGATVKFTVGGTLTAKGDVNVNGVMFVTDDPAFKTMRGWATILETEGAISGTPVVDQHWKVKVVEEASGSRLMAKVQPGLIITFR